MRKQAARNPAPTRPAHSSRVSRRTQVPTTAMATSAERNDTSRSGRYPTPSTQEDAAPT